MKLNKNYAIGLMSGTSLDGVDLVYVSFEKTATYSFKIISSKTYSYTNEWKQKLKNAFNQPKEKIKALDIEYGTFLGNLVNSFIAEYKIGKIDFIASHGHTIFHNPEEGITLQIGNGNTIAKLTKLKVVCDFRTQDVQLGGQGAPLVPIGDKLLFAAYKYCLNLGGFANVSFDENGSRIAFDICPVNIVMNHYTQKIGLEYDDKGILAASGKIHIKLLEELNVLPFYNEQKPKSLGYEFVVEHIFPLIEKYNLPINDILRTFIAHVVLQISKKIKQDGELFVTGGGAFNTFLIDELKKELSIPVILPKRLIIDFKEALIFAFLGLLRIDNQVNCLKSVTGAKKDHSSGQIYVS